MVLILQTKKNYMNDLALAHAAIESNNSVKTHRVKSDNHKVLCGEN